MIRKARQEDIKFIHALLADYGKQGILLGRPLTELFDFLRDFSVAEDDDGNVVGCCALHFSWNNLSEVRSLAVLPERQGEGWGRRLVESCCSESVTMGFTTIFTLTYEPEFFGRLGFKEVDKKTLPNKIWADCVKCVQFPDCDEIAMKLEL